MKTDKTMGKASAARMAAAALAIACMGAAIPAMAASAVGIDPTSKARFDALDANHDGRIDSDEFMATKKAQWVKYSDGTSISVEACAGADLEPMRALGIGSGSLTAWAAQAKDSCARMDPKRTGKIAWTAFGGQAWSQFKLLDRDHDGFISPAEFADQGLSALRSAPRPNPSPAVQARMAADLAKVKSSHKTIRVGADALAQPVGADPAAQTQQTSPAAISDRISTWLR